MTNKSVDQATILTPEETIETQTENPEEQYEFHIRLQGTDTDEKLKDAATVAYRLGLIPKTTLAQLMSLFIE